MHDLQLLNGWDGGSPVAYAACDGGFYAFSNGAWKAGNDSLITTAFLNIGIDYEAEPGDPFPRTNAILGGLSSVPSSIAPSPDRRRYNGGSKGGRNPWEKG